MRKKSSLLILVFVLAFTLAGSAFAVYAASAETWQVAVGKETDATSLDSMFPKVIYIHEGDKVVFTNGAKFTPHTVTFLAGHAPLSPQDPTYPIPTAPSGVSWDGKALLNSGMMLPTQSYEITFTASGAYPYACILHPMMNGTVVVLPKGQPILSKVEQAAAAKAQEADLLLQEQMVHGSHEVKYDVNSNGALTYKVDLGSANSAFSHNRMNPESIVISEGDSVTWTNLSPYEPHFVTLNKPADLSFFTPKGEFNPVFFAPAGGKEFKGTKEFTNSGMMMSNQSYTLKFTKAGSYAYECYLHSGSKMTGVVVVEPKGAVKLMVNGKAVAGSAKAQWKNGDLYVSVTSFAQALGGKALWDNKLKAVVVTIGSGAKAPASKTAKSGTTVIVNGKVLATPAYNLKGTNYASAEEMVRAIGGTYAWNEATGTFTVTFGKTAKADNKAGMGDMHGMSH